jgi:hypothetical protein
VGPNVDVVAATTASVVSFATAKTAKMYELNGGGFNI